MSSKVKICGLTRPEDIQAAIRHGADYLGFIVEAQSARRLSVRQAARLTRPIKGIAPIVAVTVNPNDALLSDIITHIGPDYIQLHGDETLERVADIALRFDTPLIKAISVSTPDDLTSISDYDVDIILLDAKAPKGAARGGHGVSFDWNILKTANLPDIWALAGGLTPENVEQAIHLTGAPILDVSSGVEIRKGVKDHDKMQALLQITTGEPTPV